MCNDAERLSFLHSHILYNSSLPRQVTLLFFSAISLSLSIDGGSIQSLLLPTSGHCMLHSCRLPAGYFGQFTPNILSLYNILSMNGNILIPMWPSTEPLESQGEVFQRMRWMNVLNECLTVKNKKVASGQQTLVQVKKCSTRTNNLHVFKASGRAEYCY